MRAMINSILGQARCTLEPIGKLGIAAARTQKLACEWKMPLGRLVASIPVVTVCARPLGTPVFTKLGCSTNLTKDDGHEEFKR